MSAIIIPAKCPLVGGFSSLFGALWDHLENLYISNCAPVMRADDLVHLTCFSKLVRLNIDSLRGPVEARQIDYLGRLTDLQELRILFAGHGLEQNLMVGPGFQSDPGLRSTHCDSQCIWPAFANRHAV